MKIYLLWAYQNSSLYLFICPHDSHYCEIRIMHNLFSLLNCRPQSFLQTLFSQINLKTTIIIFIMKRNATLEMPYTKKCYFKMYNIHSYFHNNGHGFSNICTKKITNDLFLKLISLALRKQIPYVHTRIKLILFYFNF